MKNEIQVPLACLIQLLLSSNLNIKDIRKINNHDLTFDLNIIYKMLALWFRLII